MEMESFISRSRIAMAANEQRTRRQRSRVTVDTPRRIRDDSPPSTSAKKPLKSVSLCRPADNNVPPLFFPPPLPLPLTSLPPLPPTSFCRRENIAHSLDTTSVESFSTGPERIDLSKIDSSYRQILFIFFTSNLRKNTTSIFYCFGFED